MKKQPKLGDRKEVKRFAFFPLIIESHLKWLVMYISIREYSEYYFDQDDWGGGSEEPFEAWKTIERKLIR